LNYRVPTPDYTPSFCGCKEVDLELSNPPPFVLGSIMELRRPSHSITIRAFQGEFGQADNSKLPLTAQEIILDHICCIMDFYLKFIAYRVFHFHGHA